MKVGDKFKVGSYDYLVVSVYTTGSIAFAAVELYPSGNAIMVGGEISVKFFDREQQEYIPPI